MQFVQHNTIAIHPPLNQTLVVCDTAVTTKCEKSFNVCVAVAVADDEIMTWKYFIFIFLRCNDTQTHQMHPFHVHAPIKTNPNEDSMVSWLRYLSNSGNSSNLFVFLSSPCRLHLKRGTICQVLSGCCIEFVVIRQIRQRPKWQMCRALTDVYRHRRCVCQVDGRFGTWWMYFAILYFVEQQLQLYCECNE